MFFIVYFSALAGIRALDAKLVQMAQVVGASERAVARHIVFPGAVPYIFTGFRIAMPYSIGGAVIAELISANRGLGFVLADMAAAVSSARATYLDAARRRDLGWPYSQHASVAKLVATDAAMKVTTDAVQVLGGVGYTRDYRVERYMREAALAARGKS